MHSLLGIGVILRESNILVQPSLRTLFYETIFAFPCVCVYVHFLKQKLILSSSLQMGM